MIPEKISDYLKRNLAKGINSFVIATHDYKGGNHWYIHPEGQSGETLDIYFDETTKSKREILLSIFNYFKNNIKPDNNWASFEESEKDGTCDLVYEAMQEYADQQIADKEKERLYWQQRCEAAENYILQHRHLIDKEVHSVYNYWKQLKDQKPKEE